MTEPSIVIKKPGRDGVKHQPADLTPLPWQAHDVNNGAGPGVGHRGAPITARGIALGRVWESHTTPRAKHNADYLVHAANAYPRLIEALRRVVNEAEIVDTIAGMPVLNVRLSHRDTVALHDLLRDLGEES